MMVMSILLGAALTANAVAPDWSEAMVIGHTEGGDKMFFKAGDEVTFKMELTGVKGAIPPNTYFYDWKRTANDGKTESGRAPVEKPLIVKVTLDRPGFVRLAANVVTADGKLVPKKHMWEKRVFFEGGAGFDVDKIELWPEPKDFDEYWAGQRKLCDDYPLRVLERKQLACQNPELNLWHVKIDTPDKVMPATGYLVMPKVASVTNRMSAVGMLSGYYNWGETCPSWITNSTGNFIRMYINRHGCEGDREAAYYEPFLKAPKDYAHFHGMALRGMMMFRYLKSLPEWDGKHLKCRGSSGGAMQSVWMGALVPGLLEIKCDAPAMGDVFGSKYGHYRGYLARTDDEKLLYFDICYHARRVKCPAVLSAGLGDYVCPPFSQVALYRNIPTAKQITWSQGHTHGWHPKGMATEVWSSGNVINGGGAANVEELTAGNGGGKKVLREPAK